MLNNFTPDALIFDIDGVLLNVENSFPEVIRTAINECWESMCGGCADSGGYTAEHERILKRHGAFNDDYDIAWVLLSMAAGKGIKKLSLAFPSEAELVSELQTYSGSVEEWCQSRYGNTVPRDAVRKYCYGLYGGTEQRAGLHLLEVPMLTSHWKELPLPVGIYTGRDLREWSLAKVSLGWEDFPIEHIIHLDTGIAKPSPEVLEILCRRLNVHSPLFFGDTAADMKAMQAFGKGSFAAIGSLLPEAQWSFRTADEALEKLLGFKKNTH